jgi:hypothetical protein
VHQIKLHTSSTLDEILNTKEATRKIAKWVIELSMHDIVYKPRTAIKAQALSDFIAEWRLKHLLKKESWNIGPSILTDPYSFKA